MNSSMFGGAARSPEHEAGSRRNAHRHPLALRCHLGEMRRARLVALPMHRDVLLPHLLHAVHADVADPTRRILAHDGRHGQERTAVLRPRGEHRELVEIDVGPLPHDLLAGRAPRLRARREFGDLQQPRQQLQLAEEALGDLQVEQLRDAVAVVVELLHAERHRHARHRAEEIDRDRELGDRAVAEHRLLEQQCRAASGQLHHAVGDLAHLEMHAHRLRDALELAHLLDGGDELLQGVERVGHLVPTCTAAIPKVSASHRTSRKPAALIAAASTPVSGKFATERGR
jgi:hypothetical protein